jgi:exodeoxyribonuclease V beta subunit
VAACRGRTSGRTGCACRSGHAGDGPPFDELAWLASDDEAFDARSELLKELHSLWLRLGVLAMQADAAPLELPARWLKDMGGERRLTNYLHLAELLQRGSACWRASRR